MQNNRATEGKENWFAHLRHSKTFFSLLILFLSFALLFGVLVLAATPKQYAITVGVPAPETITATKDVENEAETERRREEARNSISEKYMIDSALTTQTVEALQGYLSFMVTAREKYTQQISATPTPIVTPAPTPEIGAVAGEPAEAAPEEASETPPPTPTPSPTPAPEAVKGMAVAALAGEISVLNLTDSDLRAVLEATEDAFTTMAETVTQMVNQEMNNGIRPEDLNAKLDEMGFKVLGRGVPTALQSTANALIRGVVQANKFVDEAASEQAREEEAAAVEPVMYKKGQNVVMAGEVVEQAQYDVLKKLGLLEETGMDKTMFVGMGIMIALMYATLLFYLLQFEREMLRSPKLIVLLMLITMLEAAAGLALRTLNIYLIPVQLGAILVAMLLKPRLALTMNMVLGVIVGVLATGEDGILAAPMLHILLMSLFGGAAVIFMAKRAVRRSRLLYSGFALAVIDFATLMAAGVLTSADLKVTLSAAISGAVGGLLSAVLAVGLLPLMESMFNLVTPQMLLELSTPTQPLLRLLQTEAPGTHHHSLLVANLAEAAADRIGANALLCRVGAYYHDIGKTRRPIFFKENQIDQPNPHDGMEPQVSAAILAAHVRDGLVMADKYKLPRQVKDMIGQHHGDSLMAFFYHKAKVAAEAEGKTVDIADFRYDGPRPQSKEAAILMMADTVEAAARTLRERTVESITGLVSKLVREKLDSGQLSDAPLTLKELNEISEAFIKTLTGIYHERIEYPKVETLLLNKKEA